MSEELAIAVSRRMIARADAKARQRSDGEYMPDRTDPMRTDSDLIPWSKQAVLDHLAGKQSYGHYLLDKDSTCKLFVLDIDLVDDGPIPSYALEVTDKITDADVERWEQGFYQGNPREAWRDRSNPARGWMKSQFRHVAGRLASVMNREMKMELAVAYSGNKGIHVYGFTGRLPAFDVRQGAQIALDLMGGWEPVKGRASTFAHKDFQHLMLEIYPKQDTLSAGSFGNLVRLPLGKNLKSPSDPTFFVDMSAPLNVLKPVDPLWALTDGAKSPWSIK